MPINAYDMAITLALHASQFVQVDDEGSYEMNIAELKKLIQQLLDISSIYDDNA